MPTIVEMPVKVIVPDFPPDELLISEDGVPLESDWHGVEIELLRDLARWAQAVHSRRSKQLQLWLGTWNGAYLNRDTTWLRFYTKEGALVPTAQEAAAVRVETAQQEADNQRQRADAAEAELAKLKSQVETKNN